MPQKWRFIGQAHAADLLAPIPDLEDDFNHVVHMALRVDAARNCQTDQVELGISAKHQRANLDRADSAFEIQFVRQRDAGELIRGDVRQKGARIEINRVAARRLHDGDAMLRDVIAEVSGGGDAIAQIVFVERLLHADGDGFEITSGQTAIGWVAFGQDEQILFLLCQ